MGEDASVEHLEVWQFAHAFVLGVYRVSREFPREEIFGLTSQVRRAAISVPANITEGYRKLSSADEVRYYNISQASLDEAAYHLRLAHDLAYADTQELRQPADRIARMLSSYIRRIRQQ
jgi:four helix bundle protein